MRILGTSIACIIIAGGLATRAPAVPGWWAGEAGPEDDVIEPGATANHFAVANLGQAKWMATRAYAELSRLVPDGPGFDLHDLFPPPPETITPEWRALQYKPLNIGQLKALAQPFYDEIHAISPEWLQANYLENGLANWLHPYPWDGMPDVGGNRSPANTGQLKMAFSIYFERDEDEDGIPDLWEYQIIRRSGGQFQTIEDVSPHADFDEDGVSNIDEFTAGTDPAAKPSLGGSDLAGHWTFDRVRHSKVIDDDSGFGRVAILESSQGLPAIEPSGGMFAGAVFFDGFSDAVRLPHSALDGAGNLTVAFWLRRTSTGSVPVFRAGNTGQPDEFSVTVGATSTLVASHGAAVSAAHPTVGSPPTTVNPFDGDWHHFAVVRDQANGRIRVYVDGEAAFSGAGIAVANLAALDIGQGGALIGPGFLGRVDDVRIYTRSLAQAEVRALRDGDADEDGLPDWWERHHMAGNGAGFAQLQHLTGKRGFGVGPGTGDYDADGLSDRSEYLAGTDPTQANQVPGLVLHYELDDALNAGSVLDSSGNGHHALPRAGGATAFPRTSGTNEAMFGGAMLLTYATHEEHQEEWLRVGVSSPSVLPLDDRESVTFCCWIKGSPPVGETEGFTLLGAASPSSPDEMRITLESGTRTVFHYFAQGNPGVSDQVVLDHVEADVLDGGWHHVALVRDGSADSVSLIIDGEAAASGAAPGMGALNLANGVIYIGQAPSGVGANAEPVSIDGRLDDVRIYGRGLGVEEVAAIRDRDGTNGGQPDGIPDWWQQSVVDGGLVEELEDVQPGGLHPGHGVTFETAFAEGLSPTGTDALTVANLRKAFNERLLALANRQTVGAAFRNETVDPAPPTSFSWSTAGGVAGALADLNHMSYELDYLKVSFLNVERDIFRVGGATATLELFDDDSLPPLGRVGIHNYRTKIPQLAVAISKLRYLSWPIRGIPQRREETHNIQDLENDAPVLLSAGGEPDAGDQESGVLRASLFAYDASVNGYEVTAQTFDSVSSNGGDLKGSLSILEKAAWTPYSLDIGPNAANDLRYVCRKIGDINATIQTSGMISNLIANAGFETVVVSDEVHNFKNLKYVGADPALHGLTGEQVRAIYATNDSATNGHELYGSEEFLASYTMIGVFAPRFTFFPDIRPVAISAYGGLGRPGDFSVTADRGKVIIPLGEGLHEGNHLGALVILADRPVAHFDNHTFFGWDIGGWIDTNAYSWTEDYLYPEGQVSLTYPTSVRLFGPRGDFDTVYEKNRAALPPMGLPEDFSDDPNVIQAKLFHRLRHWLQAPIRQVKGGRIFADLSYDEAQIVIRLYWASAVGERNTATGEYAILEPGAFIREIVITESQGALTVVSGGRIHSLSGSGTPENQTWTATMVGPSGEATSTTGTIVRPGSGPNGSRTLVSHRNGAMESNVTTVYEDLEDPFQADAAIKSITLNGSPARVIDFTYNDNKAHPFNAPGYSAPRANYGYFRLESMGYSGDESWANNGGSDTFEIATGRLSSSERTAGALVRKVDYDDNGGMTVSLGSLGETEISEVEVAFEDGDLAKVTTTSGGAGTSVTYGVSGPYPWTARGITHPDGSVESRVYRYDRRTRETRISAAYGDLFEESSLDELGSLFRHEAREGGVVTARMARGARHYSGAPESFSYLGGKEVETWVYDKSGNVDEHQPIGSGKRRHFYNGLNELTRTFDYGTGVSMRYTVNPGGLLGSSTRAFRGGQEIETREEKYNFYGEVTSGKYGRSQRPTELEVSPKEGGGKTYTWTTGEFERKEDFRADGFLEKEYGASVFPARKFSEGLDLLDRYFRRVEVDGAQNIYEQTSYDSAGRVAAVERPSAAPAGGSASWHHAYVNVPGNVAVTVTDPDGVKTRARYEHGRIAELGVVSLDLIKFEYGSADGALKRDVRLGDRLLHEARQYPANREVKGAPYGDAALATRATGAFDGNVYQGRFQGPGGYRGEWTSVNGLHASMKIRRNGTTVLENEVQRHPDLRVSESSGRANGSNYETLFEEATLRPTQTDGTNGKFTYSYDETAGSFEVLAQRDGDGRTFERTEAIDGNTLSSGLAGTGTIHHKVDLGIAATGEMTKELTRNEVKTTWTANPAGAIEEKLHEGDQEPLAIKYTAAGRIDEVTNRRDQTTDFVRDNKGRLTTVLPDDVSTPGYAFGYFNNTTRVSGITETGTNGAQVTYGQSANLRHIETETMAGGPLPSGTEVVVDRGTFDAYGNPSQLNVVWDETEVLDVSYAADEEFEEEEEAGSYQVPSGRVVGGSVGDYSWTYAYEPLAGSQAGRDGVKGVTLKKANGVPVIEAFWDYYGDSAQKGRLKKRTTVFRTQGDKALSFEYEYNPSGLRESVEVALSGSVPGLAAPGDWEYEYWNQGMLKRADLDGGDLEIHFGYNNGAGVRNLVTVLDGIGTPDAVETASVPNGRNRFVSVGGVGYDYDNDGNLLNNGQLKFEWNAYNQLAAVRNTGTNALVAKYVYDFQGRRTVKERYGVGGALVSRTHFVYDGWNPVYERTTSGSGTVTRERKYVWGTDISGSGQGAGGIGGLLMVFEGATVLFPVYDAHGNVVALANADTGAVADNFAYDPFGNPLAAPGTEAAELARCPFRFSTKYYDAETGLYYYGYRYYDPKTGSWLSRDPLGEEGGMNLYGFVENDPVNSWDYLGMATIAMTDFGSFMSTDLGATKSSAGLLLNEFLGYGSGFRAGDSADARESAARDLIAALNVLESLIPIYLSAAEGEMESAGFLADRVWIRDADDKRIPLDAYRETGYHMGSTVAFSDFANNTLLRMGLVQGSLMYEIVAAELNAKRNLDAERSMGMSEMAAELNSVRGKAKGLLAMGVAVVFDPLNIIPGAGTANSARRVAGMHRLLAPKGGVQYGTAGDAFLTNASRATQPAGMMDVAVHGSPMAVEMGSQTVNHRVLANLVSRNPEFTGQPIRLLSCETGCLPNGFAQNLSNKLGVPVHAPNDIIWAYPNGRLTIGPTAGSNTGSFVPFVPGGNR